MTTYIIWTRRALWWECWQRWRSSA